MSTIKELGLKIYGIGGLGVDERVFSHLELNHPLTPLKWIKPYENEDLEDYAARFAEQIDTSIPFIIIGVSFGGMLALELNKILNPDKIILISSATTSSEIPWAFRVFGKIMPFNLIPNALIKPPAFLAYYFFGVSQPEYKRILKAIIADTDITFLRWALQRIIRWDNKDQPKNLTRIHGASDKLLKNHNNESVSVIRGGGHFIVMDRASEVSRIINQELGK